MTPWERTVAALKGTRPSAEVPNQMVKDAVEVDAKLAPTPWQRTKTWITACPAKMNQT
jgi:hypothetical protein